MKVLVLGASGMIGNAIFHSLSNKTDWIVTGTVRNEYARQLFGTRDQSSLILVENFDSSDELINLFSTNSPDVVINCVGLTKHRYKSDDPLVAIPLNSLLPHRLARLCELINARLVHISTDCVFSGKEGFYTESDIPDADDLYGRSKVMGEVICPHAVTLRTSTIGHELSTKYGLLEWFLSQNDSCKGFDRAIFSGLPSVVFAEIIRDIVIPNRDLTGLYHVAAEPINKFELLKIIANVYEKKIDIEVDDCLVIDRSLNPSRFAQATGYLAPDWEQLIRTMHSTRCFNHV